MADNDPSVDPSMDDSDTRADTLNPTPTPTPAASPTARDSLLAAELPPVSDTANDYMDAEATADVQETETGEDTDTPEEHPDAGRLDQKGTPFDPTVHKSPPSLTPGGRWRRMRKPKTDAQPAGVEGEALRAATTLAGVYAAAHMIPFGSDAAPSREDMQPLIQAWELYMRQHGVIEIPAGLDVGLAHVMYTGTIIQREPVTVKIQGWFGKIKSWWKARRVAKRAK